MLYKEYEINIELLGFEAYVDLDYSINAEQIPQNYQLESNNIYGD